MIVYLAPKLLGSGMGLANLPALNSLAALPDAQNLIFQSVELIGDPHQQDLRIALRTQNRKF